MIRTIGFPNQYHQGPDALDRVGLFLKQQSYNQAAIISDDFVTKNIIPDIKNLPDNIEKFTFNGECTASNINTLSAQTAAINTDVVIAIGGGKSIDTAKGVAQKRNIPIIICPTIASTDAPTSRLIVLYDEQHRVTGVDYLNVNPSALFVDTRVIANAPSRLFSAGVGDAISKYFESQQCFRSGGLNSFNTPPLKTALLMAQQCFNIIMTKAEQAYQDIVNKNLSESIEEVIEATVLLSGVGFESGGLSLAHSLIRGFTRIPALQNALHGEMVAFGTLVQLHASGYDLADIKPIAEMLIALSLPVTLAEMGLKEKPDDLTLCVITEATLAHSYAKNFMPELTPEHLLQSILAADACGKTLLDAFVHCKKMN
ncbi:glycerol dehydrogenase [Pluralibacter gergoviae]|uniref:glycerol dehydrogenase n=1 Tax=Pluralibacter gergoviae TaxID=61647 RepID=UPI0005ED415E|nr:glycerol dehydrogenase [Pluralibacter gergoviae]KJM62983.1 hypothetical protein SS31_14495 [Pluralibacter gergoviae]OUR02465.1 glycerol dehydrogenase [Pluralibacter gergoviae]